MKKYLLIFTFVALVVGAMGIAVYISSLPLAQSSDGGLQQISVKLNTQEDGTVSSIKCQEDVQLCENGSYISRNPLQGCQFNCNNATAPLNGIINCPQDVKQCEDGSFVIRNPNNKCEFKNCK